MFMANILRVLNNMKILTPLQKRFVKEYLQCLDGELAAKRAGYNSRNLKLLADSLLENEQIIGYINRLINSQLRILQVPKCYVIKKLLKIAEFSLEEEDILDKKGSPTGKKKLRDSSSALKALEALCKYLWSKDDNSKLEAKIITISNLDDNKI